MTFIITSCPACASTELELVEAVSIDPLADLWTRESFPGKDGGFEAVRAFISEDLGQAHVEFWMCRRCGLEHARPMSSWSSEHYPQEVHGLGFDHFAAADILKRMPQSRVLDIGCADGLFLERGATLGHEMTGIDFSAEDVESARRRGLDAHLADVGEIEQLFDVPQNFDVVTLFQVIEHLREPDHVFEQIARVAGASALLIVGCPSDMRYTRAFNHPQRIGRSDFWDYPPQHTLRWTPKALEIFLARHGWRVESVTYEPFSVAGAAAHLTTLHGLASTWHGKRWRRRLVTLGWLLRAASAKCTRKITGIRLLVTARRVTASLADKYRSPLPDAERAGARRSIQ
jgi:SAM-dependent methyltransferase